MLVDVAFALIKARYYLDNALLTPLQYEDHVQELKCALAAYYPPDRFAGATGAVITPPAR